MSDRSKTAVYFILTFLGIGIGLASFTTKTIPSFIVSFIVSVYFYYDPKKVKERNERLAKKAEVEKAEA